MAEQHAALPGHARAALDGDFFEPLARAERVCRLRELAPAARHDWSGVHNEFHHELILTDRSQRTLLLIIAADD